MEKTDHRRFGFLLLLVVATVFQLIQLDDQWDRMDGDDAQYIMHARSLLVNHRYNDPNLFYTPKPFFGSKSAPPGWPLLLVPVVALFGKNLIALKLFVILISLACGWLLYRIVRVKMQDGWMGFWIAAVYYFSMTTIVFSRVVYSEWPYLFTSLLIVYFVLQRKIVFKPWLKWFLVGLGLGLCLLFRSVGGALVFAVFAVIVQQHLILERKLGKTLLCVLMVILPMVGVYRTVNWAVQPEKSPGYEEQLFSKDIDFQDEGKAAAIDIVKRIPQNAIYFVKGLFPLFFGRTWHEYAEWISPRLAPFIDTALVILGGCIVLFIGLGFYTEISRKPSIVEYYMFFYLAIMAVVWFNYEVYRYLMLITSFLLFYFIEGIRFAAKKAKRSNRFACGCIIGIFAVNVLHAGAEIYKYKYSSTNSKTKFAPYLETVTWLKLHVPHGEMVVADDPRWYALETGLNVTMFPITRNEREVFEYIKQWHNPIVVYDQKRRFSNLCLLPVLERQENRFKLVKQIGHLRIYEFQETKEIP